MIGRIINDRYRLDAEIGHGGMGIVYKGHDLELERDVVIKVLNRTLFGEKERERLVQEAKVIARLNHPNIVSVYDLGEFENSPFFVMEFVEGRSLREHQPIDLENILPICTQICIGLEHAHENGIIHRDLKPENILFDKNGRVKLVDFGIARSDMTRFTTEGSITGTVNYMAPEIAKGEEVDGRADLYSLGVIMYELTTGEVPLKADSLVTVITKHLFEKPIPPNEKNPDLPLGLNDLILCLLSKNPEERPSSAKELRYILEQTDLDQFPTREADIIFQVSEIDSPTHNITDQPSSFIGREEEITQIGEILADPNCRLVTLVGIGGIGKTRLATQIAINILEDFKDGVWLVELAKLTEPDFLPQQVASVLGVSAQEAGEGQDETDVLVEFLNDKNLLVVLDNCEHLVEACATFTETLLKGCPHVKVLATSREDLRIPGETTFPVSPMDIPPNDTPIEQLPAFEAVRLFVERATAVRRSFELTSENSDALVQICHQLDGIPLALELAAARVKVLALDQIAERLQDRFQLLTSGSRTALPRHQTLEATMDWSYNLLSETERVFLRQLSIFSGGWTLDAAEKVTKQGEVTKLGVLNLLSQLVDKSLIFVEEGGRIIRYGMLETVRQYGKRKLIEQGEIEQVHRSHAAFYVQLAEEADEGLRDERQIDSIDVLENEHNNLRVALRWSINKGETDTAFRLVSALGWFWFMRGYWKDSWTWLIQSLDLNNGCDPMLRTKAIYRAGGLELIRGNVEGVTELVEEALSNCRDNGDIEGTAWCLNLLGQAGTWGYKYKDEASSLLRESFELFSQLEIEWGVAWALRYLGQICEINGDYEQSINLQKDGIHLFEGIGDIWNSSHSLYLMGNTMYLLGDNEQAKWAYEQSLEKCKLVEDKVMSAHALRGLAMLAIQTNDLEQAEKLSQDALEALQKIGDENCSAATLRGLGEIARRQGEYERAFELLSQSLIIYMKLGNDTPIALTLERFAALARSTERAEEAARLLAAVEARIGATIRSSPTLHAENERLITSTRNNLGDKVFEQLWAEGTEMSLDEAITLATHE